MGTLEAHQKACIADWQLHGGLAQMTQPRVSLSFVFWAQKPCPGWHSLVSKKQNYRSLKARLVHFGTSLDEGYMDKGQWWIRSLLPVWQMLGPTCWALRFEWCFYHGVCCVKIWGLQRSGVCYASNHKHALSGDYLPIRKTAWEVLFISRDLGKHKTLC